MQSGGKLTEKYGGSKLGEEKQHLVQLSKFLLPDWTLAQHIRLFFSGVRSEYFVVEDSVLVGWCAISLDFQTFRKIVVV